MSVISEIRNFQHTRQSLYFVFIYGYFNWFIVIKIMILHLKKDNFVSNHGWSKSTLIWFRPKRLHNLKNYSIYSLLCISRWTLTACPTKKRDWRGRTVWKRSADDHRLTADWRVFCQPYNLQLGNSCRRQEHVYFFCVGFFLHKYTVNKQLLGTLQYVKYVFLLRNLTFKLC